MKTWTPSNISKPVELFPLNNEFILEFQDNKEEWHNFNLIVTKDRIVFGGYCNVGFIESGYIEREEGESFVETLQELLKDLQVYYNDGPEYISRIICNERM
jgi:hypothetical protein